MPKKVKWRSLAIGAAIPVLVKLLALRQLQRLSLAIKHLDIRLVDRTSIGAKAKGSLTLPANGMSIQSKGA